MPSRKSYAIASSHSEDDYQTESDLRMMIECEKIEKDPKRLKKVQELAKKRLMDLAGIASEGEKD
jgi:hypothetical protein